MYARDWLETHIKKSQVSYTDRVHVKYFKKEMN